MLLFLNLANIVSFDHNFLLSLYSFDKSLVFSLFLFELLLALLHLVNEHVPLLYLSVSFDLLWEIWILMVHSREPERSGSGRVSWTASYLNWASLLMLVLATIERCFIKRLRKILSALTEKFIGRVLFLFMESLSWMVNRKRSFCSLALQSQVLFHVLVVKEFRFHLLLQSLNIFEGDHLAH